jgi:hypothetical protein
MVGINPDPESLLQLRITASSHARAWKNNGQTRAFKMVELISRGLDAKKNQTLLKVEESFLLTSPFIEPFFQDSGKRRLP